jgi:predicted DNA-binding protein YlxM (UPF0122 family)
MSIQEEIKAEMIDQDMNPGELADASGVSRSAVYDYIAGRRDLTGKYLDKLLAVLGLEVVLKE